MIPKHLLFQTYSFNMTYWMQLEYEHTSSDKLQRKERQNHYFIH